ncbi:alpha/beta fold hydrolase [Persicobacter psychrovividus]|uniref:Alpha/beta hydrolase n=1 Tax=Persicobacter psychrovividus TaxID=387638 RepID=A0ABN6L9E4_9BACT|nr:alpha/beta hydrolase [Persicobacter psychrovividus]
MTSQTTSPLVQSSDLHLQVEDQRLFIKQWHAPTPKAMMLCVHGAMENGKIFYSKGGRGFAPFMAQQGYEVFVVDLSGRGRSEPTAGKGHRADQTFAITTEIPAVLILMQEKFPSLSLHLAGHSWGGVLILAAMARSLESLRPKIKSMIFFGSKRSLKIKTLQKRIQVDIFWSRIFRLYAQLKGYFPAKELRIGSDNEPLAFYTQVVDWVNAEAWQAHDIPLDYAAALQKIGLPPTLYLAGKKDLLLGHIDDVKRLKAETGAAKAEIWWLAKSAGFQKDYGHIDMLTARSSVNDHFPKISEWIDNQPDNGF